MKKLTIISMLILATLNVTAFAKQPTNPEYQVSPALDQFSKNQLMGDVWKRSQLSVRDRSLVTISALIARNQTTELAQYVNLGLDNGIKPTEISEIIYHLSFYAGRENALTASKIVGQVFSQRDITAKEMPLASPTLLPLDEKSEAKRNEAVKTALGDTGESLAQYTAKVLFHNLWLRPDLSQRDRSLVTISALIASGQVSQMPYHLNRAMDKGLTKAQAEEIITHLAFYVGWPNAFSAQMVAKNVFEKRKI